MKHRNLNILISSGLILAFTTFNVGIPIVKYLCPMMSRGNPNCEMIPPANNNALSFASEMTDCCAGHIIAERNTVPYLSAERLSISHLLPLYQVAHVSDDAYIIDGQSLLTGAAFNSPSPPFRETVSLSILNSTLLI
jgi:hypothetical protein